MRKAQSSLEFLMTYGWALVAILTVIAALYSFGVLDINQYLPEQCRLFSQIECQEFATDGELGTFNLSFVNNYGVDMTITNFELQNPSGGSCSTTDSDFILVAGATGILNASGCNAVGGFQKGNRFEGKIAIDFFRESDWCVPPGVVSGTIDPCTYTISGTILANID